MAFKPIARSADPAAGFETERAPLRLLEVRAASTESPGGGFDAIAQLWAPAINDWRETFLRGCFSKSIRERVFNPRGSRVRVTDAHNWTCEDTLGTVRKAVEADQGLQISGDFSSTDDAQAVRTKMQEGHLDEFSIEFRSINETCTKLNDMSMDGALKSQLYDKMMAMDMDPDVMILRAIKEAVFWGVSVLPYSAQGEATLLEVRGLQPFQDLAVAGVDTPWEPAAALERVSAWAKGEGSGGGVNWARFRRAFLVEDAERRGTTTGYDFQIADVVDGQLRLIPRALMRAAARLVQDRGLDAQARTRLQAHMDRYFDQIQIRAPWHGQLDALVLDARSGAPLTEEQRVLAREALAVLTAATTGDAPPLVAEPATPAGPEGQTAGPDNPPTVTNSPDAEAEARAAADTRQRELREAELRLASFELAYAELGELSRETEEEFEGDR